MKKLIRVVAICALVVAMGLTFASCSSLERGLKSISSDFSGGIERTVTVYDYNGKEIRSWSGKFDVSESENEVYFDDANGKRVIIHGGIVINEEK